MQIRLPSPHRSPLAAVLAGLLLATGCITADGTLERDGSVNLTLSYPTVATATDDAAARALVKADGVTIQALEIVEAAAGERGPRRATAKLQAKGLDAIGQLPILVVTGTSIQRTVAADGGGSVAITVKNPHPRKKSHPEVGELSKHTATILVHLPGTVAETTGSKTDGAVEWKVPAGDWLSGTAYELKASWAAPAEGAAPDAVKDAPAGS